MQECKKSLSEYHLAKQSQLHITEDLTKRLKTESASEIALITGKLNIANDRVLVLEQDLNQYEQKCNKLKGVYNEAVDEIMRLRRRLDDRDRELISCREEVRSLKGETDTLRTLKAQSEFGTKGTY